MQTQIKDLLENTDLPQWMTSHSAFKSIDKFDKIFPRIGLSNFSEPCELKGNFATEFAKTLVLSIQRELEIVYDVFTDLISSNIHAPELYSYLQVISQIDEIIVDGLNNNTLIVPLKGKLVIKLPRAISEDNVLKFKRGTNLIDVYNHCKIQYASWVKMPEQQKLAGYKEFNAQNFSCNKTSIVFSSTGCDGLWDLATMSMRGITSCVRWDGQFKLTLIGSMVDPFTGIIYLSSGKKDKYGISMIKRCIVRFVIDGENNKPYILIDRMYPSFDKNILNQFIDVIQTKTSNHYQIQYGPTMEASLLNRSYIPQTPSINNLADNIRPYRDTKIPFGKTLSKISERKIANVKIKLHNLRTKLKKNTSIKEPASLINNEKLKQLLSGPDFLFLYNSYTDAIIDRLTEVCNVDKNLSSDEHIKQLCYYYFANKQAVLKTANQRFVRYINKYYGETKKAFTVSNLKSIIEYMVKETDKTIKQQALTIVSKQVE